MGTDQVLLFLDDMRERLKIIHLTEDDYYSTVSAVASEGSLRGAVYDALLARCALKAGCEIIYTWNIRDFSRLGPEIAKRTRTP